MDFGDLLMRAWQITWKHKVLWIFGILAGIGAGGGNGGGGGGGERNNGNAIPPDVQNQFNRPEILAIILCVACVLIVIALVLFVMGVIARGGLIGGIRQADDNDSVTFDEAWALGVRYFWRMLGIGLILVAGSLFLAFFGAFTGLVAFATLGIGVLCLLPVLCVLVVALIALSILAHFAQFAVILEDYGVVDAFRRGWDILKTNLANIIVIGIIMFIIQFIAGLLLVAPFFAIVIPTLLVSFVGGRGEPNVGVLALGGLSLLCYLPIAIVLGGILNTWSMSVWTLAYRKFIGGTSPTIVAPPTPPAPLQPT
jgi:hypothetical protein